MDLYNTFIRLNLYSTWRECFNIVPQSHTDLCERSSLVYLVQRLRCIQRLMHSFHIPVSLVTVITSIGDTISWSLSLSYTRTEGNGTFTKGDGRRPV